MRYMTIIVLVLATLLIVACASQPSSTQKTDNADVRQNTDISDELNIESIESAEENISAEEDLQDVSSVIDDW